MFRAARWLPRQMYAQMPTDEGKSTISPPPGGMEAGFRTPQIKKLRGLTF
jgi:hypothetical protein